MNVSTNELNQLNNTKILTEHDSKVEGHINELPNEILALLLNVSDNLPAFRLVNWKWKILQDANVKINLIEEIVARIEAPFQRDAREFASFLYDSLNMS